jgi:DNA-binding transcriptional regulator YiaG
MTPARLRRLRQHQRWTQVVLARHLGVTERTVARWEAGQTRVPEPVARLILCVVADPRRARETRA